MNEGKKQDIGITIKNEGQDSQRVLFARINNQGDGGPQVVDEAIIEPGEEIQTTLAAGLVVQLAMPPAAANDESAESPSASGS